MLSTHFLRNGNYVQQDTSLKSIQEAKEIDWPVDATQSVFFHWTGEIFQQEPDDDSWSLSDLG